MDDDFTAASARGYQTAARRLKTMRRLPGGTEKASEVDELIGELRQAHRRRPRLQQEFDRGGAAVSTVATLRAPAGSVGRRVFVSCHLR